jgi:imidazolonepropionase-like amidohydrolase
MDRRGRGVAAALTLLTAVACGARHDAKFTTLTAPVIALTHVRVFDGTGKPARDDQTLIIQGGKIAAIGRSGAVDVPKGARVRDLTGKSVLPGLVGMHDNLFYQIEREGSPDLVTAAPEAFSRLYLAAGVTSIRTAGTADFDDDLRVKQQIEAGARPGPDIDLTGPYLNAIGDKPSPDKIAQAVESAADQGATSFKAYTTLRSAELRAAIEAAHKRGFRMTGRLCAVGYREAAALGIDNIEHGIIFDTDLYSGKQHDQCPSQSALFGEVTQMHVSDAAIQRTITDLVHRNVAITSTLAFIESFTAREHVIDPRIPDLLASRLRGPYQAGLKQWSNSKNDSTRSWQQLLRLEMDFERAFVAAGGRLMAGVDPSGWGGIVAGSGDQRELELLVEAGFSPEAAIRVATLNGATFLHKHEVGALDRDHRADLFVVAGDPSAHISDIRHVELVMKEGVGYDPAALRESAAGSIGAYDIRMLLRWPANAIMTGLLLLLAMLVSRLGRRSGRHYYGDPWNIKGLPKHQRKVS